MRKKYSGNYTSFWNEYWNWSYMEYLEYFLNGMTALYCVKMSSFLKQKKIWNVFWIDKLPTITMLISIGIISLGINYKLWHFALVIIFYIQKRETKICPTINIHFQTHFVLNTKHFVDDEKNSLYILYNLYNEIKNSQ